MLLVPGIRSLITAIVGVFRPGSGTYHADTINWINRVNGNGGTVPTNQIAAVDTAVRSINSRGLKVADLRYNPQVGDALAIVVPVYVGAGLPALDVLHGSPTISTDGFDAGNVATKYSDTGINPSTLGSGWSTQNMSIGLWLADGNDVTTIVANKALVGAYFSAGTQRVAMYWKSAGNVTCEFGDASHSITRNARTKGALSGHRLMFANAGTTDYWEDGASAGGTNTGSVTTAPNANILIGEVNNGGINGSGKFGGYHIGCLTPLTIQNAADWADVMSQAAQAIGRMHNAYWHGDSLTVATTWANIYQASFWPRTGFGFNAVGGTTSAQCLTRMIALFAAQPCLRWWNHLIFDGQNDSSAGGWDGSNTIANVTAMLALIPHTAIRVVNMIYGNRTDEYIGQAKRATKDMVSATWKASYGAKCLNVRDLLLTNYDHSNTQDIDDIANGVTPSSLHKRLGAYNISAITKAANAAVTLSTSLAGAAVAGDVFDFAGVSGMTQVNGLSFQSVTLPDNTHMTLNVNSTGFGTYTSGGTATLVDFIHFNPTADTLIAGMLNASTSGGWTTAVNEDPVIISISPNTGPSAGGQPVTIRGSGFTSVNDVTFERVNHATSIVVVNDTTITCVTPADDPGSAIEIAVKTPWITCTLPAAYTYTAGGFVPSLDYSDARNSQYVGSAA